MYGVFIHLQSTAICWVKKCPFFPFRPHQRDRVNKESSTTNSQFPFSLPLHTKEEILLLLPAIHLPSSSEKPPTTILSLFCSTRFFFCLSPLFGFAEYILNPFLSHHELSSLTHWTLRFPFSIRALYCPHLFLFLTMSKIFLGKSSSQKKRKGPKDDPIIPSSPSHSLPKPSRSSMSTPDLHHNHKSSASRTLIRFQDEQEILGSEEERSGDEAGFDGEEEEEESESDPEIGIETPPVRKKEKKRLSGLSKTGIPAEPPPNLQVSFCLLLPHCFLSSSSMSNLPFPFLLLSFPFLSFPSLPCPSLPFPALPQFCLSYPSPIVPLVLPPIISPPIPLQLSVVFVGQNLL